MELSTVLSFIGVSMLLTLSPGPDNLFVVAQSVSYGRRAGLATALGLCTGITVHTMAAGLGLSAILYQSNLAFQIVKYAGAVYLLYLAWQALREGPLTAKKVDKLSLPALYRRGILMNVLNPKVSLFFLALLPQFVSPHQGSAALQMIELGLIFMAQAILLFSLLALFAGSVGQKLVGKPRVALWINRAKAGIFSFIAIRLALLEK
ncbi:LysE family translocator [Brevibacillus massiliensis]|jgi:threonine/homoserine/homoserine lactone efflux protein|uniref:LysE family translocator n=1 Tax=Brevibacillus massiliensis TaxID=1118054 RepID=UPI00030D437E|nr:LysE family translocator [Brevibacillus massiliensis]